MEAPSWLPVALGYVVAVVGNYALVRAVVKHSWAGLGGPRPSPWITEMLGPVETVLYLTAWLAGRVEFIPIWLTLKVASHWPRWTEAPRETQRGSVAGGRAIFNLFLLGNGLSILNATAAARGVTLIEVGRLWEAGLTWGAFAVLGIVLLMYAKHHATKEMAPPVSPPRDEPVALAPGVQR